MQAGGKVPPLQPQPHHLSCGCRGQKLQRGHRLNAGAIDLRAAAYTGACGPHCLGKPLHSSNGCGDESHAGDEHEAGAGATRFTGALSCASGAAALFSPATASATVGGGSGCECAKVTESSRSTGVADNLRQGDAPEPDP